MIFTDEVLPERLRKDIERTYPNQNLRVRIVHTIGDGGVGREVVHDRGADLWTLTEFGTWYNVTEGFIPEGAN